MSIDERFRRDYPIGCRVSFSPGEQYGLLVGTIRSHVGQCSAIVDGERGLWMVCDPREPALAKKEPKEGTGEEGA